jgi:glycosyltransferase involved in cell wall biosynthesis
VTRARVLRVITRMNVGGPALHVALLTSGLDPDRYETLLVSGREGAAEGSMLELGRAGPVRPVVVPSLRREIGPLDAYALWRVLRIARAFRPDIVHTHLAKAGVVGRIAARLVRARAVVHTYHGTVFRGYFGERESGVYVAIERALSRISTHVVAITPQQRRDLLALEIAPESKIVEIPLGLDLGIFRDGMDRAAARSQLGIEPDALVVGIVARLVPIKDVATFLRAVAMLKGRMPRLTALVVGGGEERALLEAEARRLDLGASCRFLGWRADMPRVYAAMDLAVLTSLNEGSPVSVIEAMAAGLPVVATSVGGVPDVVDAASGVLVPPRDPGALADAIERVLSAPDRGRALGLAGRARAFDRYDSPRLIRDIDALYTGSLSGPRSSSG